MFYSVKNAHKVAGLEEAGEVQRAQRINLSTQPQNTRCYSAALLENFHFPSVSQNRCWLPPALPPSLCPHLFLTTCPVVL